MFCIHCGNRLPDGAAFCPACGARTGEEGQSEKNRTPETAEQDLVCTACGSHRLKRIRRGQYLCEYCGSRIYTEEADTGKSDEARDAELMALFTEAAAYEEKDDIRTELQVLARGLAIAPDNGTLMLKLGRAYWRLGDLPKAREYYQRAGELNPEDPIVFINIGTLYLTQGQYAQARPQYERGLAIMEADPLSATANDIAVAYGNYALCLGELGDKSRAKEYLKIAKEKGYSQESINNICARLRLNPRKI